MALLPVALIPFLFALQAPLGVHELDALPESVRARAALIFTGTYVTKRGLAVQRGDMEIFPLVGSFQVKTTYLGAVPESIRISPAGHDLQAGRRYLVLLRPEPDSWNSIENGQQTELTDDEIVAIVYLPPQAERVDITDFGIFGNGPPEPDPRVDAPTTSIGYLHVVDALETPVVLEHTELVKAAIGKDFGLLFCAEGDVSGNGDDPVDDIAPIHIRVLHPTTHNPVTGRVTDRDEWDAPANLGIIRFTGWRFDAEWEIVPGTWTIEIVQGGIVMARKEFVVTN